MNVLLRVVAVIFVAVGGFLIYAVINAMTSDEGAKTGVAILYVAIALVLGYAAWWMWGKAGKRT
jgi:hypothetical protein